MLRCSQAPGREVFCRKGEALPLLPPLPEYPGQPGPLKTPQNRTIEQARRTKIAPDTTVTGFRPELGSKAEVSLLSLEVISLARQISPPSQVSWS